MFSTRWQVEGFYETASSLFCVLSPHDEVTLCDALRVQTKLSRGLYILNDYVGLAAGICHSTADRTGFHAVL